MFRNPVLVSSLAIAGATLGAGIFVFPFLASTLGVVPLVVMLGALGAATIYAHALYWRVLATRHAGVNLLELAREHLGAAAARGTFLATVIGLLLTLSAYIVLGSSFLEALLPLAREHAVLLFWIACSLPLAFRLRRFMQVELLVTAAMGVLVLVILGTVPIHLSAFPRADWSLALFALGPILFALSGWTAVEPALASVRGQRGRRIPALVLGTGLVALAYLLFGLAMGSSGLPISTDTVTGIAGLHSWQLIVLCAFGFAAIVTSYLPVSLEVKNALRRGLSWPRSWAFTVVLFFPYLLVLSGFDSFLGTVELVGGVFIAVQYLAILQVARVALGLRGGHLVAANVVSILFALAAVLHVARFVAPLFALG